MKLYVQDGTPYHNSWSIWAYGTDTPLPHDIFITTSVDEAIEQASMGKKVLLHPAKKEDAMSIYE